MGMVWRPTAATLAASSGWHWLRKVSKCLTKVCKRQDDNGLVAVEDVKKSGADQIKVGSIIPAITKNSFVTHYYPIFHIETLTAQTLRRKACSNPRLTFYRKMDIPDQTSWQNTYIELEEK